jgi:hypothetical protein
MCRCLSQLHTHARRACQPLLSSLDLKIMSTFYLLKFRLGSSAILHSIACDLESAILHIIGIILYDHYFSLRVRKTKIWYAGWYDGGLTISPPSE